MPAYITNAVRHKKNKTPTTNKYKTKQCGVFSGLQSERYPSSFLAARRISSPLPRPLSLTVGGVANHAVNRFNPMVTFFTALRWVGVGVGLGRCLLKGYLHL